MSLSIETIEQRLAALEERTQKLNDGHKEILQLLHEQSDATKLILEWIANAKLGVAMIVNSGYVISWMAKIITAILVLFGAWFTWKTGKFPSISISPGD